MLTPQNDPPTKGDLNYTHKTEQVLHVKLACLRLRSGPWPKQHGVVAALFGHALATEWVSVAGRVKSMELGVD